MKVGDRNLPNTSPAKKAEQIDPALINSLDGKNWKGPSPTLTDRARTRSQYRSNKPLSDAEMRTKGKKTQAGDKPGDEKASQQAAGTQHASQRSGANKGPATQSNGKKGRTIMQY